MVTNESKDVARTRPCSCAVAPRRSDSLHGSDCHRKNHLHVGYVRSFGAEQLRYGSVPLVSLGHGHGSNRHFLHQATAKYSYPRKKSKPMHSEPFTLRSPEGKSQPPVLCTPPDGHRRACGADPVCLQPCAPSNQPWEIVKLNLGRSKCRAFWDFGIWVSYAAFYFDWLDYPEIRTVAEPEQISLEPSRRRTRANRLFSVHLGSLSCADFGRIERGLHRTFPGCTQPAEVSDLKLARRTNFVIGNNIQAV